MEVIGITGGIGSGKSTVARIISDLGGKIIDADSTARRIMKKGNSAFTEVIEFFGEGILKENGQIDRKKLAAIVFNDTRKLNKLNEITHKYVANSINRRLDRRSEEHTSELQSRPHL